MSSKLGLAGLLIVTLAACGTQPEPAQESKPEVADQESTKADAPAAEAPAEPAADVSEPCALTDPETVAAVFGGSVDTEAPGTARNCSYLVTGGSVPGVEVFYYGTAPEWDGIRDGYEANRGPLADVSGVGDEAFHPGDVGANELVVRSGEVVFAVGLGGGSSGDKATEPKVKQLAVKIADSVG